MRELQGAILVGSVFQMILGYTGLMSLLLRYFMKPSQPTFYYENRIYLHLTVALQVNKPSSRGTNYCCSGFGVFQLWLPQAGSCVEISMPLIVLVLLCTLVYAWNFYLTYLSFHIPWYIFVVTMHIPS